MRCCTTRDHRAPSMLRTGEETDRRKEKQRREESIRGGKKGKGEESHQTRNSVLHLWSDRSDSTFMECVYTTDVLDS